MPGRFNVLGDGPHVCAGATVHGVGVRFHRGEWCLVVIVDKEEDVHPDGEHAARAVQEITAHGWLPAFFVAGGLEPLDEEAEDLLDDLRTVTERKARP